MTGILRNKTVALGLVVLFQLGLVAWAVDGQLSARLTGDEYFLRVGPVDPIDPLRGAYVELSYPDLGAGGGDWEGDRDGDGDWGDQVFIPLERDGDVLVAAGEALDQRPDEGVYLTCSSDGWRPRCGIESLFLPQERAAQVQRDIDQSGLGREFDESGEPVDRDSGYVARLRIDGRGNAAVIGLEKR